MGFKGWFRPVCRCFTFFISETTHFSIILEMKLFKYIVLIIIAGFVILRLLYVYSTARLNGASVTEMNLLLVTITVLYITFAVQYIYFYKKIKNIENNLEYMANGHNTFVDEVQKFADDYNKTKAELQDAVSSLDNKIEETIKSDK